MLESTIFTVAGIRAQEESRRLPRKRSRGNSDDQQTNPEAAAADNASAILPADSQTATAASADGSAAQPSDASGAAAAAPAATAATVTAKQGRNSSAKARVGAPVSQPRVVQAPIYISPESLQQHAHAPQPNDNNGTAVGTVNSTGPSAE